MSRLRFACLALLIALLFGGTIPASAQTQQPQLFLPQVGTSPRAIGEGPSAIIEDTHAFVPEDEVIAANSGYANFYCAYGQRANHRWYVSGPGYMSAQWWLVSTSGGITYINRTYYASGQGYIYASMTPSGSYKVTRVNWSYSGIANNSGSSCG